jgi:hypothetical protein
MLYIVTMIAAKMFISHFLLPITIDQLPRRIVYVAMGLRSITGILFLFVTMFQCNPTLFSKHHVLTAKCLNDTVYYTKGKADNLPGKD